MSTAVAWFTSNVPLTHLLEPEDNESDGESAGNKKKAPAKFKPDFTDGGEIKIPACGTAGVDGVRQKGAFVRGVFSHYYSMSLMLGILSCHF